jgi:hypothetical protein
MEKPHFERLKVVHGPHRLRLSGVEPQIATVTEESLPFEDAGEFESVGAPFDLQIEVIPLQKPE